MELAALLCPVFLVTPDTTLLRRTSILRSTDTGAIAIPKPIAATFRLLSLVELNIIRQRKTGGESCGIEQEQ